MTTLRPVPDSCEPSWGMERSEIEARVRQVFDTVASGYDRWRPLPR